MKLEMYANAELERAEISVRICSICRYRFDASKKHTAKNLCQSCFKKCDPNRPWKGSKLKKLLKGWKTR